MPERPPRRVLIVDDDADLAEVLGNVLRGVGFTSAVAHNGQEALEALRRDPGWSLVLLDLMMPVMNGWQFRVEQLGDPALAAIPVVALSGGVKMDDALVTLGVAGCLRKPFSRQELLALVANVCEEGAGR
jgi:CheY-like chemotaxis protein